MTGSVDLSPAHRAIVECILAEHVPECEVRAFGSRATWTAKDYSDLDLAVVGKAPLPQETLAHLREAFEDSPLPMRVDVLDWHAISERFRGVIERDYVVLQKGAKQKPAGEWRRVVLGDVVNLQLSSVDKKSKANEQAVQLCNYMDVYTNNFIHADMDFMTATATEREIARCSLAAGDVLITKDSEKHDDIGVPALVREEIPDLICGYHLAILRSRLSEVDGTYLFYALSNDEAQQQFHSFANGITRFGLRKADIGLVEIPLPPLSEQRVIAHILGTLDDKIELNRRMNQTLEEMARALFKSWFVDFDPVRAKAALKKHSSLEESHHSPHEPSNHSPHEPSNHSPHGPSNHSPREGESDRRGALAPTSRWGEIRHSYSKQTLALAKALRQRQTDAEGLLWHYLRRKQLGGYKFRRQQPIGPYVVDFACMPEKLVVELDGGQHAERAAHDERRAEFLRSRGFRLVRFWNNEVFENCFGVLERVYEALRNPPPRQSKPGGSTAATPPQGGSDEETRDSRGEANHAPSPSNHAPSSSKGEGWGGGAPAPPAASSGAAAPDNPTLHQGTGDGTVQANEWTVERARAYLDRMDQQIADLFPDRLVPSELGEIPEGWEVTSLGESAKIVKGRSYRSADLRDSNVALVTLKSVKRHGGYSADGLKAYTGTSRPEQVVKAGDVIVAQTDVTQAAEVIGRTALVQDSQDYDTLVISLDLLVIRPAPPLTTPYLYRLLQSHAFLSHALAHVNGTTVLHMQRDALPEFRFSVPSESIISSFTSKAGALDSRSSNNSIDSYNLAHQRDTLLPGLVSGAIQMGSIA